MCISVQKMIMRTFQKKYLHICKIPLFTVPHFKFPTYISSQICCICLIDLPVLCSFQYFQLFVLIYFIILSAFLCASHNLYFYHFYSGLQIHSSIGHSLIYLHHHLSVLVSHPFIGQHPTAPRGSPLHTEQYGFETLFFQNASEMETFGQQILTLNVGTARLRVVPARDKSVCAKASRLDDFHRRSGSIKARLGGSWKK